jgi:hypothetical protein
LADAAKDQAQAADDTAAAASDQVDAANNFADSAEQINRGVAGAVSQLQATANNAKNALDASIEASRLDERAWVGIQSFSGGPVISGDHVSHVVTVIAKNTGKTPALRISGKYIQVWTEVRDPVPDYYDVDSGKGFRGRGNIFEAELFPPGDVLAPQAARELKIGGVSYLSRTLQQGFPRIFYILGKITYDDTDGKAQHTTKFCLRTVERNQADFMICPSGNWMD